MIRKDRVKGGGVTKTYIRVVEGYRPGPGMPTKQRTIKSFGYLEDQEDPDTFMAMVEEFNANLKEDVSLRIEVASNALMYTKNNRRLNYGYKFLETVYKRLGIEEFINRYKKAYGFKGDYSLADILKFLVLTRILRPDSNRASCQIKRVLRDGYRIHAAGHLSFP